MMLVIQQHLWKFMVSVIEVIRKIVKYKPTLSVSGSISSYSPYHVVFVDLLTGIRLASKAGKFVS